MRLLPRKWYVLAVPLLIPVMLFHLHLSQDLYSQPANLKQVVELAKKATFEIKCDQNWVGAGWAIEIEGVSHIVTAHHVLEDCLSGEFIGGRNETTPLFSLDLVSSDGGFWNGGTKDLALLRSSRYLPSLVSQTSAPAIGQWVIAVGFPLEEWSAPLVNVSAGRVTGIDRLGHVVTNSAINAGNSGGPLINSRGQVVGTIYSFDAPAEFENLGYAQPVSEHCGVLPSC